MISEKELLNPTGATTFIKIRDLRQGVNGAGGPITILLLHKSKCAVWVLRPLFNACSGITVIKNDCTIYSKESC